MTKRLYIIGNGFDLHHGIPSRYSQFGDYLLNVDPASWRTICEYLFVDKDFWACFEERLASFDEDAIIDYAEQFLVSYGADDWSDAYHHDFEYEIEQVVDALSRKLRDHFAAWIRQLPPPVEGTYSLIRSVDPGALFLTFNYTPTLETLYGATPANVLHIHGNASVASDQIVLGHGWERLDEEKLSPKVHEDTDTRFAGGYRLIDSYFADTFKPTIALIERNSGFFGRISNVDEVFVLGHSLSEIDAPYLHEVIRRIRPDATWTVSYHGSSAEAEDRMNGLGVSPALSRFHPLSLL
jgi:hypothetical protein